MAGPAFLSPRDYCVILDMDGGSGDLRFQLMPDTITEAKSANYEQLPIIGRSLPYMGYANSSSRQIGLSIDFAAVDSDVENPEWVKNKVRWLESKVYPRYNQGFAYPPPRLKIVIGSVLGMTAVMTNYNTTWMKPWSTRGNIARAFRARVDCQFEEIGENGDTQGHPFDHDQVKDDLNQVYEFNTGDGLVTLSLADGAG